MPGTTAGCSIVVPDARHAIGSTTMAGSGSHAARDPVSSEPDLVVYFVRHGRCTLNADGVLWGRLDPDLDKVGCFEAHALAERLKEVPIDRIVSSPLLRAHRTAEALAATTGAEVESEEAWADRDHA